MGNSNLVSAVVEILTEPQRKFKKVNAEVNVGYITIFLFTHSEVEAEDSGP